MRRREPVHLLMVAVLSAAAVLPSCGTPITYTLDIPAEILAPVETAGVADGRARYRQILCELLTEGIEPPPQAPTCDQWLNRLTDEPDPVMSEAPPDRFPRQDLRVFIVPGYMGDAAPAKMMPWGASLVALRVDGYQIDYIRVSGGGSADHNAAMIADFVRDLDLTANEKLVLVGYSKGTIDILHFLVNFPEVATRVAAIVSIAGAVNGSPLADEVPANLAKMLAKSGGGDIGDAGGMNSLKRSTQIGWMARNTLPSPPRYFCLAAFTNRRNVSSILLGTYDRLALVDPMNDGQMIHYDQIIPGSTLLGYANGDHWAVALPFQEQAKTYAATLMDRNKFPRTELLEAALIYVQESLAEDQEDGMIPRS